MQRLQSPPQHTAEIVEVPVSFDENSIMTKIIDVARDEAAGQVNLQDADIIVSGGRGLKKPENFAIIRELADALGGVVGASRPTVDDGWIAPYHQVGQTGSTVQPRLYIAHLAGMSGADCIVAINTDPAAPIFEVAHYGIVGDLFEVVPALTKIVREQLGSA